MIQGGADFSKLKLRYYSADYRGVHAKSDIKAGETLLYVPRELLIITEDTANKSSLCKQMIEKNYLENDKLALPYNSVLSTYQMEQRKKETSDFA